MIQVNLCLLHAIYMGWNTQRVYFVFRKCLNYDKKLTHENNTNQYLDV